MVNSSEVLGALRIDLLSAGTITKLIPMPNGTLDLVNATGKPSEWMIPLNITSVENASALKSWKIYVSGVELKGYALAYDPVSGYLSLSAAGTLMFVQ